MDLVSGMTSLGVHAAGLTWYRPLSDKTHLETCWAVLCHLGHGQTCLDWASRGNSVDYVVERLTQCEDRVTQGPETPWRLGGGDRHGRLHGIVSVVGGSN